MVRTERYEKWLQRETGDPMLRLKWDNRLERFVVGRLVRSLAADYVEWFYTVTDGDSNFRPIDHRTVRKILSLDTWRRAKQVTEADFVQQIEESKKREDEKRSEVIKYRLKHNARYIKKLAEQDGYI